MTGRVVGGPSTSGGGAGGGGGVAGGGGDGSKKRRRESKAPHDQSEAVFKDDGDERPSRKRDMLGEVLEFLHKNEDGGGRTREMDLQALVSQQSTMITSLTSLLQQEVLLKNALRLADDDDDMQELEDELQDANTSRKRLRGQLRDLEEHIRKETNLVAQERNEVVEQEEQEQNRRRARAAKAARVLSLSSCASPAGEVEGSGGGRGSGGEHAVDEDDDDSV